MKMSGIYNWRSRWTVAVCGLVLAALVSCHPDEDTRPASRVPEGEEAMVSLKWTLPAMDENTFQLCSPISEERANAVQDMWVGIYNKATGERTSSHFFSADFSGQEHKVEKLENVKTRSGESYVVAVANVYSNFGVSELVQAYKQDTVLLATLLDNADTWDKYKSISFALPEPTATHPALYMAMAGSFHKGAATDEPTDWSDEAGNPETVTIGVGMNEDLGGYIHLRRLFAYNRFTIKGGPLVKMVPVNWQVCQLPLMSYLQERRSENSADVSTYFEAGKREEYRGNHGMMPVSHIFEAGEADGEYVFDFYSLENRHAGLRKSGETGVADYVDREREWKAADGTNTAVYKSLCRDATEPKPGPAGVGVNTNNYATYVVFRAEVSYWAANSAPGAPALAHPDDPKPSADAVLRTAYATYTVHLGYCEGKAAGADSLARDFNVRRNHWYDYKVQVNGLANIALEASNGTVENQPGAEGDVFDNTSIIEVDAHNAVFNIQMSNRQRANLQWIVSAPYGSMVNRLTYVDYPDGETADLRTNRFYDWIRFKPAPTENLLALYKETETEADSELWTLEDLRDVANHPGIDDKGMTASASETDDTPRWYTVFVKEYVYEDGPDETTGNWKQYVNHPDRVAYLNTRAQLSDDKESIYMMPQYTIIQKSIQTYYNLYASEAAALGLEHENEGYGLNLRWSKSVSPSGGAWNRDNGRWNAWDYLTGGAMGATGKAWYGTDGILADLTQVGAHRYAQCARTPAINRQYESKEEMYHPVYALRAVSGFTATNDDPASGATAAYAEIMAACLNRNRDENGNGRIDMEELKWYLATSGKYLRIILGDRSLTTPLMQYGVRIADQSELGHATRHHYATSDQKIIWAEEGVSSSGLTAGIDDMMPWQVRCVRNLGVDFSRVLETDPVPVAYHVDEATRIVSMDYYDEASIRPYRRGTIPVHTVDDRLNMVSRRFEYAPTDCGADGKVIEAGTMRVANGGNLQMSQYGGWNVTEAFLATEWGPSVAENTICGQYYAQPNMQDRGTWRVPNQKELTILFRAGLFSGEADDIKWLSCSQEYYTKANVRYFGVIQSAATLGNATRCHVRCVRDIEY